MKAANIVLGVCALLVVSGITSATTITILNPSFEDPYAVTYLYQQMTDWTVIGNGGVYGVAANVGPIPDGRQCGMIIGGTTAAIIHQDLTATIQEGYMYTLSIYIGARTTVDAAGYDFYLYDVDAGVVLAEEMDAFVPTRGSWTQRQVSYTANDPSKYGHQLAIYVKTTLATGQTVVDMVQLDAVPEPATLGLLALGGVLCGLRRRK